MSEILEQTLKDFEQMKEMNRLREKGLVIEEKMQYLGVLESKYNTKLHEAIEDETKLQEAVIMKEEIIQKKSELDELLKT